MPKGYTFIPSSVIAKYASIKLSSFGATKVFWSLLTFNFEILSYSSQRIFSKCIIFLIRLSYQINKNISTRCNYLSIRALHPETLVNPFPKKCVVVAQRLSTFDNDIISIYQHTSILD